MKYQVAYFDLDGTLVDSAPGILGSMQKALEQFGVHPTLQQLRRYLGPPLQQMFADFLRAGQVAEGGRIYRQYYVTGGGLFDALVYDGVPEALARLQQGGVQLCLATAKPKATAQQVLDHFGLSQYFAQVGGTVEEAGILDKTGVIRNNLQHSTFAPGAHLMVGDRRDDLQGAAAAGIDALGVLYGYGSREELAAHPHMALCESPGAVAQFILTQG